MAISDHVNLEQFMAGLKRHNPNEPEFHQAVYEIAANVFDYIADKEIYHEMQILRRICVPDRIVIFRVCWQDDNGNIRVNKGYRVQNNNSIGPYKGGLRFDPSVNLSILKFLAFEQTFKNSLTGLPLGGAKGGSDFNIKGKSDGEVMRFCQSFMTELHRHVGEDIDVPAGDIGVGAREIGYLFGQWKRLTNRFVGVLTGKGLEFGGSPIRKEATGYGTVYMMENMMQRRGDSVEGKTCLVSGAGNVATYTAEKLIQLGAKVVTLSDSAGFVYDREGLDSEKLAAVIDLKTRRRERLEVFAREFDLEYHAGQRPWKVPCDLAFPCATQNELSEADARTLINNGCLGLAEGANMPTEQGGIQAFTDARLLFAPSKAANAGGVAISGLEMSQNAERLTWKREELDKLLREIMQGIHGKCVEYGQEASSDYVDYVKGANIGGFIKVANAMIAYGVV
ncbi:MAG: NADP-specific glutamate dehydrogenase [Gammaproteobacteria bacterium]